MGKERDENRALWNEWTPIHIGSRFYDLESFRSGETSLNPTELSEVGDVRGKSLLHLQCHFGMDSLSWVRLGARVTGIDFSEQAVSAARKLSAELGLPARFVCSTVEHLSERLDERFDIVFTSYGTICWLADLVEWARTISGFLRPGGMFYIVDTHPLADVFAEDDDVHNLEVRYDYFAGEPLEWPVRGSYAEPDAEVRQERCYVWQHPLGEIVTALLDAGLVLRFLHEFDHSVHRKFPFMTKDEQGLWRLPPGRDQIPLLFSIRADKPR